MPITRSAEDTMKLAEDLIKGIDNPTCIALIGPLGAGKTVFVKGIAHGLGIDSVIQSPTFVLMRSYQGRLKLYHIDLYRIGSEEEIILLEEYFLRDGITVIEWADRIKGILPDKRIDILLNIKNKEEREITINDYR
ncbi:tRNA (adenosine(37)-N6)-threonylcarbamoyltransferase complex ATPase subunit type 1 TsaE [candidate division WOR-3 bacterium]|nr:tRNA (adenosine(37)-N6)-threonylcarbamoyltransferase complex ATPase subunit type 1 TsaE [candidate division WOR-3 bacterium]